MSPRKKKTTRRQRRKFTDDFKADVVRLCQEEGETIASVCRRLDLTETAVRRWVTEAEAEEAASSPRSSSSLQDDEREELKRLRRQVKRLEMEREILKKAATFFAKENS